ncbi:blue copper protein 1a-like [Humulus lupulus]|uniref:blue copper protein 1a-like n=1 Tax=Humulus lupulus TaxID=3486 RepID=UPI002B405587|nr:blue copper protein 1a-like [Humulus lupulus]
MAFSSRFFNLIVLVAIFLPTIAIATDYVVGDDKGWTNNGVDYEAWAKDKDFKVGDALVFNYKPPSHNVYKVDGAGFTSCNTTSQNGEPLTSGNDRVELQAAGNKWYICGKEGHCGSGQKLKISVKDSSGYNSAVHGIAFSAFQVIVVPLIAVLII